jgi:hypothetical protein
MVNNLNKNNSYIMDQNGFNLISNLFDFWEDFCIWIRLNENLYNCLLTLKNTIFNNKIIVLYVIVVYYLYQSPIYQ